VFGKPTRTIVCPSCGRLTRADATECFVCGRRWPGMFGLSELFRKVFSRGVTISIIAACAALYVLSLVFDPAGAVRARGPFDLFAPSTMALWNLGAAGVIPWEAGRWWTLVTAIYLHGSLLHILFNVLWIRHLGPAVEEAYGPARFFLIFTVSGAAGFVMSNFVGIPFTVGASGSIFGLLGAMVAFGRRRGGTFGTLVLREYGQWAVVLFILGFLMPAVNNWAHAGGFLGGMATGLALSVAERHAETSTDHVVAGGLVVLTVLAFLLALWAAFVG
jgi:rhomboid protease GluP